MRYLARLALVPVLVFATVLGCGDDAEKSISVRPTELTKNTEEMRDGYTYIRYLARQPDFRDRESDGYLDQKVEVAIPTGVENDAPVIVLIDGEAPLWAGFLTIPEKLGWSSIYVQLEHRGYGQSLSNAADQTVPDYVSADNALKDAHGVVSKLRETYTGPWLAYGISYSGGLVIEYAGRFPDDVAGVLSSSGVIDWPLANTPYDETTRERLGEQTYAQLIDHMKNLEPSEPFDANWVDREFLQGIVAGISQYASYQSLVPAFQRMVDMASTEDLVADLRALDEVASGGQAADYAESRSTRTMTREQALEREPSWRVYFWQQCTDIGTFNSSAQEPSIWQRGEEGWREDCRALFDVELNTQPRQQRSFVADMERAGVPLVFLSGGNDPWRPLGLEVPPESARIDEQPTWSVYETSYGRHFHIPDAFHNPEAGDLPLAQAAFGALFDLAGVERKPF